MNEYEPFFRDGVTDEALEKACNYARLKIKSRIIQVEELLITLHIWKRYGYLLTKREIDPNKSIIENYL